MKNKSFKVKRLSKSYPENDFITEKFDTLTLDELKKVRIVFSTPRSGSTYLCSKIHEHCGIIGHEYFQASGYIQYLARRWDCYDQSMIMKEDYWKKLVKYRSSNQTLVINLHGSHLSLFEKFIGNIKSLDVSCLHLIRANVLEQSVSYTVARKTGQWTKYYDHISEEDLVIKNEELIKTARAINGQNLKINAFIYKHQLNSKSMLYEHLIKEGSSLEAINDLGLKFNKSTSAPIESLNLTKQNSSNKDLLIKQFCDFI